VLAIDWRIVVNKSFFMPFALALLLLLTTGSPSNAQFARAKAVLPPPPIPQGGGSSNIPGNSSPSEKLFDELEVVGIAGNQAFLRTEERVYLVKNGEDLYMDGIKYRTTVEAARVRLGTEKSKDTFDDVLILTLGSAKSEKKASSTTGSASSTK
jgi:hypothetical protein